MQTSSRCTRRALYVVGITGGSLDGPNAGMTDGFTRKYHPPDVFSLFNLATSGYQVDVLEAVRPYKVLGRVISGCSSTEHEKDVRYFTYAGGMSPSVR
jgi:hypothetical protein